MDTVFPFGFALPTAFYLTLYVVTFALHQAVMHYVVGGSLYLTGVSLTTNAAGERAGRLTSIVRDWLPFWLGAAITAGVAPLLFVQIVYPYEFYSANVLLFWRWMVVVPALIITFYALYLIKSQRIASWPRPGVSLVIAFTTVGFIFVGFCWSANHLIALRPGGWPALYAEGKLPFTAVEMATRMGIWLGGALIGWSALAGLQLKFYPPPSEAEAANLTEQDETRRVALIGAGGLVLTLAAAAFYLNWVPAEAREAVFGWFSLPYLVLTALGALLVAAAWALAWRAGRIAPTTRWLALAGWILGLLGMSVVRESIRLSNAEFVSLAERLSRASGIGGLVVFLLFAVINFGLIGYCVWLVARRTGEESSAKPTA